MYSMGTGGPCRRTHPGPIRRLLTMIWFFQRGERRLVCEIRQARDGHGYELAWTTPDGQFCVQEVECLGYCDLAPVLQVNFDYHEKITTDQVDRIIADLSK